jgi:hypothetical protein
MRETAEDAEGEKRTQRLGVGCRRVSILFHTHNTSAFSLWISALSAVSLIIHGKLSQWEKPRAVEAGLG